MQGGIQRACANGLQVEKIIKDLSDDSLFEDLAIDWNSRKMFWSNSKTGSIEVSNLDDGSERRTFDLETML